MLLIWTKYLFLPFCCDQRREYYSRLYISTSKKLPSCVLTVMNKLYQFTVKHHIRQSNRFFREPLHNLTWNPQYIIYQSSAIKFTNLFSFTIISRVTTSNMSCSNSTTVPRLAGSAAFCKKEKLKIPMKMFHYRQENLSNYINGFFGSF